MFHSLISPPRKVWIAALASLACLCGPANSQNFTMQVTNPDPLGLGSFIPRDKDLDLSMEGKVKGAFAYGVAVSSEYNSNFFLTEKDEESELYTSITPRIGYVSDPEGGATVAFTANYQPVMRAYLENSDLNGMDQAGDFTLRMQRGRTGIDVFGQYQSMSGTDRLTGDFVEGSVMTGGFRATRQIAPRTSLNGGWSVGMSDYGNSTNEGANVYTSYLGGTWTATERLSVGSTIRYSVSESDNTGTRDAWALLLETRYQVGERIWLSASLGPEYSMNSGDGGDDSSIGITGDISARYVIDERWSWTGSIRSAAMPSPDQSNFIVNNVAVTTLLQRQLLRGVVSGGFDLNVSGYQDVGTTTANRSNELNPSAIVSYGRSFFKDRVALNSSLRYSLNEGQTDWSQFIFTLGAAATF